MRSYVGSNVTQGGYEVYWFTNIKYLNYVKPINGYFKGYLYVDVFRNEHG